MKHLHSAPPRAERRRVQTIASVAATLLRQRGQRALTACALGSLLTLAAGSAVGQTASSPAPTVPAHGADHSASEIVEPSAADGLFPGPTLTRRQLVATVLERNLDVRAATAAWEAARQRVDQVTALPDPEVALGMAPLSIGSSDVDFGVSLEARQRLPYPGKLELRGDVARARAESRREAVEERRLGLARLADALFFDLYLVDRAREINDEHIRLLEEFKQTATNRYATGQVPQQVPLQAEVELTHLVHRAVTLRSERSVAVARLNALLHRPPAAPLPRPVPEADATAPGTALEQSLHHGSAAVASEIQATEGSSGAGHSPGTDLAGHGARADADLVAQWADRAVASRPELTALDAERAARRVERELAGLERRPDLGFMAQYSSMWRQTDHRLMVGVTVSLPIWRARLDAAEAEADAALAAVEARRGAAADAVRSEVAQAAERLAEMAHVVDLYESRLMPAAADQLRAARAGFETGQVAFTALVDAERNLRSVELGYEEARTDRFRRRADLERAIGLTPDPSRSDPDPSFLSESETTAPAVGGAS